MMMTAMNVAVAFQTMLHTVGMSCRETAPTPSAMIAPSAALQPTPRPLGCQMTSTRVNTKTASATSMGGVLVERSAAGGSADGAVVHALQARGVVLQPLGIGTQGHLQHLVHPGG